VISVLEQSLKIDARLPLTPALSLGERENNLQRSIYIGPSGFWNAGKFLPLPEGEGWGEGERTMF